MSASLVGSEMCIRDRNCSSHEGAERLIARLLELTRKHIPRVTRQFCCSHAWLTEECIAVVRAKCA
eukprot:1555511-Alexandrium_andersonii.AAC.1